MKSLASLNLDQMKGYFLVTHLQEEHTNVTIKGFERLLNVLMLSLMSLLQLLKKKNKQKKKMMVIFFLLHQMEMIQRVDPMKNLKMIYQRKLHPDMFKIIILNLKFWETRNQVYKQGGHLWDLLAIWHSCPQLNTKMSIKLAKMNFGFKP